MAKKFVNVLRKNLEIKLRGMRNELQKYGLNPPYIDYRAKRKAIENTAHSFVGSYAKLPQYAKMVRRTNVSSIIKIKTI